MLTARPPRGRCSYVGGYSGVRHLRAMRGTDAGWRGVALRIAWTIPGSMFGLLTLLNAVIWHTGSIGGVPAWVLAVLFVLWTVLATPLCFLGALHARRGDVAKDPTTTNKIPRVVPPSGCGLLTSPLAVAFLGGILPFGRSRANQHCGSGRGLTRGCLHLACHRHGCTPLCVGGIPCACPSPPPFGCPSEAFVRVSGECHV